MQQGPFAAECRIKTGPAQPCRTAQVIQRSRLESLGPERLHRALQRRIAVKFAGPGHLLDGAGCQAVERFAQILGYCSAIPGLMARRQELRIVIAQPSLA